MIVGLGCDVVNIERIELSSQHLAHFAAKILGPEEKAELDMRNLDNLEDLRALLAKYYAAKEAFAKALGSGFRNGIFLKDIQVLHNDWGKPSLKISGDAEVYLHKIAPSPNLSVTLSDDFPMALAVVIIEQ